MQEVTGSSPVSPTTPARTGIRLTYARPTHVCPRHLPLGILTGGRSPSMIPILLWILGVPGLIIILLLLFGVIHL